MSSSANEWIRNQESVGQEGQGVERYIYIVSDGTGETAANIVRALITQFSDVSGVYTRRYPKCKSEADVDKVMANADQSKGPVMVAYTLVNAALREYLLSQLQKRGMMGYDLFSTLLAQLSKFFGSQPGESPDLFHGVNERYFKRMEAIEFTLRHDDGKNVQNLSAADIILVGVSRTGKTPLSMYLSLYGHKVVNIPLAPGIAPPPSLFDVPQNKIVALTIDPTRLVEIRKRRITGLNMMESEYSDPSAILEEVEEVNAIFRKHRRWPIIDVTNRSIEETATLVRDRVFGRDRPAN